MIVVVQFLKAIMTGTFSSFINRLKKSTFVYDGFQFFDACRFEFKGNSMSDFDMGLKHAFAGVTSLNEAARLFS